MAEHPREQGPTGAVPADDRPAAAPRSRSGGFFRALVAAAAAAAAPAAGCYESDPGEDVADISDATDTRDVAFEVYGLPDGLSEAAPVYGIPDYGVPEYAAPDYGVP
ncbi:MAG: hypothetical protein JXB32_01990 [Deltaproteobacteria bacterium]|nr:hypothetical protein [Deltaproteobacteria bacterium]